MVFCHTVNTVILRVTKSNAQKADIHSHLQPCWLIMASLHKAVTVLYHIPQKTSNRFCSNLIWEASTNLISLFQSSTVQSIIQRMSLIILSKFNGIHHFLSCSTFKQGAVSGKILAQNMLHNGKRPDLYCCWKLSLKHTCSLHRVNLVQKHFNVQLQKWNEMKWMNSVRCKNWQHSLALLNRALRKPLLSKCQFGMQSLTVSLFLYQFLSYFWQFFFQNLKSINILTTHITVQLWIE